MSDRLTASHRVASVAREPDAVAGLPSSAVGGVVSAVLALGVGFLNICKDTSSLNAIYLNGGVPGVVIPRCWAQ